MNCPASFAIIVETGEEQADRMFSLHMNGLLTGKGVLCFADIAEKKLKKEAAFVNIAASRSFWHRETDRQLQRGQIRTQEIQNTQSSIPAQTGFFQTEQPITKNARDIMSNIRAAAGHLQVLRHPVIRNTRKNFPGRMGRSRHPESFRKMTISADSRSGGKII